MSDRRLGALTGRSRALAWLALLACALVACALVACAQPSTPAAAKGGTPETLRLTGSTAAAPLLYALIPAFQKGHPGMEVVLERDDLNAANAALAQRQVAEGAVPLAVVAGPPDDNLWAAPVAVDALAVIVHADNPLSSLTLAQVRQVFSGRTWRWSDLSVQVPDEDEIIVVSREPGSGSRAAFESLALGEQPGETPTPVTSMAVLRLSSNAVVTYVAEHPAAIGYLAWGALEATPEDLPVRAVAIEDVLPGPRQLAEGTYRLSLPLFFVAPSEPTGTARQFLDFALSPQGQRILAQHYLPVRE